MKSGNKYVKWAVIALLAVFAAIHALAANLLNPGTAAPGFYLRDMDNNSFFLSKTVGEKAGDKAPDALVISFFATWCIPCRGEIPKLIELQKEFPDIMFYLVNVSEDRQLVRSFLDSMAFDLPVLLDHFGVTAKKYGVADESNQASLPSLYVIGADGVIKYSHTGYHDGDENELRGILQQKIEP